MWLALQEAGTDWTLRFPSSQGGEGSKATVRPDPGPDLLLTVCALTKVPRCFPWKVKLELKLLPLHSPQPLLGVDFSFSEILWRFFCLNLSHEEPRPLVSLFHGVYPCPLTSPAAPSPTAQSCLISLQSPRCFTLSLVLSRCAHLLTFGRREGRGKKEGRLVGIETDIIKNSDDNDADDRNQTATTTC